jgi:uncharacterized protein
MESVVVRLDDRLANAGDTLPFAGHLVAETYELSDRVLQLPNGIDYDLMLTNAGEGILATGIVRAMVTSSCDRCLDETTFEIAGEVDEYFLFHRTPPCGILAMRERCFPM